MTRTAGAPGSKGFEDIEMKKAMIGLLAVGLVTVLSSPARAATFTVDTFLSSILSDNSGQGYEEAQLELACSCLVTLQANVNLTDAEIGTDDAGNNYIDVDPSTPGFFLLKYGIGKKEEPKRDMFFFENIGELNKLVWTDFPQEEVAGNCRASLVLMVMPRLSSSGRNNSSVRSTTSFKTTVFNCSGVGRIACRNCVTM